MIMVVVVVIVVVFAVALHEYHPGTIGKPEVGGLVQEK